MRQHHPTALRVYSYNLQAAGVAAGPVMDPPAILADVPVIYVAFDALALGPGYFDAKAAGDLVAHAGVAILHVITIRRAGGPKLMQIAWMTAGGRN